MIMVVKHPEQRHIWVKNEENTVSLEANIWRLKKQKKEMLPILHEYCPFYGFNDRIECKFHATSLNSTRGRNLSLAWGDMYKWCKRTSHCEKLPVHAVNIDFVVIPGGMTSELHVLENKAFKDHLQQLYLKWLLAVNHVLKPMGQ
jgi:hypothetical protein